jgi:tetratricopeptide (TPR) repeat protein
LANLAVAHVYDRKMSEALEVGRRAAAIYPDNVIRRNNVALFSMYAGDFATAEREALEVIKINAEFPKAYVALALSQLAQGRAAEAEATWRRLEQVPAGRTFAIAGLADLALFRGRLAEAAGILDAAAAAAPEDLRRLVTLAETRLAQGTVTDAASLAARAADLAKDNPPVTFLAGQVLASGRPREAAALAGTLQAEIDREPQI